MKPFSNGFIKVLTAMLIWGSVGIFVRIADQPAPVIVFFRVLTAFIAVGLFLVVTRTRPSLGRRPLQLLLSGVVLSLNWVFFFSALKTTTIGNAVLTYYLAPVFAILWAHLFLREQLEDKSLAALALAVGGIGLLMSGYEFSLSSQDFIGILYGLAGAIFYSIVVVMVKHLDDVPPNSVVLVQMAVASLVFLPSVLTTPLTLTVPSVSAMLIMGIVHSAGALALYFSGLKQVKVQHAGILSYIDPMSALVFAYLVFHEVPPLSTLLGGGCILLASFIILRTNSGPVPPKEHA